MVAKRIRNLINDGDKEQLEEKQEEQTGEQQTTNEQDRVNIVFPNTTTNRVLFFYFAMVPRRIEFWCYLYYDSLIVSNTTIIVCDMGCSILPRYLTTILSTITRL